MKFVPSGPRGIRTLDLLNAIETRSQLRYGPKFSYYTPFVKAGGPGGIRTLDLFSAIEARSQLRYRPATRQIVPEGGGVCQGRRRLRAGLFKKTVCPDGLRGLGKPGYARLAQSAH